MPNTKEYNADYYQKNKEKVLKQQKERKERDTDRYRSLKNTAALKRAQKLIEHAIHSILIKQIINLEWWIRWFSKKNETHRNITYDISPEDAFDLMKLGCFYCGDLALSLDRLDSTKEHTLDNCVGCCIYCNRSKGAMDPITFVLQAVYRRTFVYHDDINIWYSQKIKPRFDKYKVKVDAQERPFELTQDQFEHLIRCPCHYCKRTPEKYFGIDKLFPDDGYVEGNVVTACASCNRAKWDQNPEDFSLREMRITQRYLDGVFDELPDVPKNISHHKLK